MLPKVEYPLFDIYLKSLDRNVKFRPFLVKEEKILLMAKEAQDAASAQLAVKQIITNCCAEDIDVDKLPLFDIEMAFVKLRAKSVGESVKLVFNCQNEVDGVSCNANTDYTLDLEKVKYETSEDHNPIVKITDTIGVKLKYPTLASPIPTGTENEFDVMLTTLFTNIEYIFDAESVTNMDRVTEKDLEEFIESLTPEAVENISRFFATTPKVVLEDRVTCKQCGFNHTLRTENLLDFFI